MGLFDRNSDKMPRGFGFKPEVCEGCPHRLTNKMANPFELCGCPTLRNFPMHKLGMPPVDCPRVEQHRD